MLWEKIIIKKLYIYIYIYTTGKQPSKGVLILKLPKTIKRKH